MTADLSLAADAALRARIVSEARRWIGTPYRHQASLRDVGADCLGLVRGVWRRVYGCEPEEVPPYTPAWGEVSAQEPLFDAAARNLHAVEGGLPRPGDLLLFRMRDRGPAKHLAILSNGDIRHGRMIHAYSGHEVCETSLSDPWRRRIAAAFRFPRKAG